MNRSAFTGKASGRQEQAAAFQAPPSQSGRKEEVGLSTTWMQARAGSGEKAAQRPGEGEECSRTLEEGWPAGPRDAAGPGQHGGLDQDAVSGRFHHCFVLVGRARKGRGCLPFEVCLLLGGIPGHQEPVSSTPKASERSPRPQTRVQFNLDQGVVRTLKAGHTGLCGEDCYHHGREADRGHGVGDTTEDATVAVGKAARATTPGPFLLETIMGRCCHDPRVDGSHRGLMGQWMWQK